MLIRLETLLADISGLFGQIKGKMLKVAQCYTHLAESFDSATKLPTLDKAGSEPSRPNRLGNIYKYMVTMFNEWAVNFGQNEQTFDAQLISINKGSLLSFSGIHDVRPGSNSS